MKIETIINTGGETGILFENTDVITIVDTAHKDEVHLYSETSKYCLVMDEERLYITQSQGVLMKEGWRYINESIVFDEEYYLEDIKEKYNITVDSCKVCVEFEAPDLKIEIDVTKGENKCTQKTW